MDYLYKGRVKEYKREWYLKNRERLKRLQRIRYDKNKVHILLMTKLWQKEHPDLVKKIKLKNKDKARFGGNQHNVLERDGHECKLCSATKQLIIHHIDGTTNRKTGQKANNEMSNLITLCRKCHLNLHKGRIQL